MSAGGGSSDALLRGTIMAGLCTLLTAVGHAAGGGTLPELALLVVLFPLLAVVLVSVAERSAGAVGTLVRLGTGQLVLHYLMVLLHPAASASAAGADPSAALVGWRMLAAHTVVTLVTAVAVRHADTALAAVSAVLRRVLPRRLAPPPVHCPMPTLAVPGPAIPARLARALAIAYSRRGPPVWD